MISGLEPLSGGEVRIDGDVVNAVPAADRGLAMVFQSYALYPHMSVRQNLSFGLENLGTPRADIDAKVAEVATMLQIEPLLERRPKALSGGQRQRVAIGRAVVREPRVFLFDEPLSNLDAELRVEMRGEISRLHRRLGNTMIYVTHEPGRGDDDGRPHRGAARRRRGAVRPPARALQRARQPVRGGLHRLAGR